MNPPSATDVESIRKNTQIPGDGETPTKSKSFWSAAL
jgi:hypothetical protein